MGAREPDVKRQVWRDEAYLARVTLPPTEWYLPALFRLTCDSVAPRKPGQEKAIMSWDCLTWRSQTVVDVEKFDDGRHLGRKESEIWATSRGICCLFQSRQTVGALGEEKIWGRVG